MEAFSYFWMFAALIIILAWPTKMYLGVWFPYEPLISSLDTIVILVALLAFASIIVNAKLQYSKSEDSPCQTE